MKAKARKMNIHEEAGCDAADAIGFSKRVAKRSQPV